MNHLSEFMSMTQIGRLFGVSSHKIGAWLTAIGLREDGNPTHIARNGGYVTTVPNGRNDGFYWVWKTRPTIKALERAGHRRVGQGGRSIEAVTIERDLQDESNRLHC